MIVTYPVIKKHRTITYRCFQVDDKWYWSVFFNHEKIAGEHGYPSCYVAERLAKGTIDAYMDAQAKSVA